MKQLIQCTNRKCRPEKNKPVKPWARLCETDEKRPAKCPQCGGITFTVTRWTTHAADCCCNESLPPKRP